MEMFTLKSEHYFFFSAHSFTAVLLVQFYYSSSSQAQSNISLNNPRPHDHMLHFYYLIWEEKERKTQ